MNTPLIYATGVFSFPRSGVGMHTILTASQIGVTTQERGNQKHPQPRGDEINHPLRA